MIEDTLYKYLKLFYQLPQPIRRTFGYLYFRIPDRIKYGGFYYHYARRIKYFRSLHNYDAVIQAQQKLLFKQVNHAVENIPFYRKYKEVNRIEDLQRFPVITKNTILDSFPEFINNACKNKRLKSNTGGSSGTPMVFYLEKHVSRSKEKAHFDWYWGQFGYIKGARMLMIRGKPLPYNKIVDIDPINNILNVSCYNVNEHNIPAIIEKINKFKPKYIHAYPSALKNITSLFEGHRESLDLSIEAAFLGSEQLYETDRHYFEDFYNMKVVNWYGHSERLIHGGNCPFSDEYHFYPAYGFIELIDQNNQPVTNPGQEGRIVATGFDNIVMPLIRYDTGDLGVLSENKGCKCGFIGTSLRKISGREQDFILLSDRTRVSLTAFIFGQHLDAFKRIREMQVVQNKIGEIELKIVKNDRFTESDEKNLKATLMKSVNDKIQVIITFEETLPKTHRGKNVFFVSNLEL